MVDPISRAYSGASNAVEGTDQDYDQSLFMMPAKFGNGIGCNEATTNLWTGGFNIYNNNSVPATITTLSETYMGRPVYRVGMTVDDAHSSALTDFRTSLASHGVYGSSRTYKANTKYADSIFWRPVNKTDIVVGGTASNIGGWTAKPHVVYSNGWKRYTATRDGSVATDKTDNVFFSFYCPSLQLNETIYIDWCCPQIEEGRNFFTEYTYTSRANTYLQYPNYPIRTLSLWVKSTSTKTVDGVSTPRTILRQVDNNDSYPQWSLYAANTNTTDCLPGTATPVTAGSAVLKVKWKTDGVNVTTYLCTVNTINILDGNWHQITCEFGIGSVCRIRVDDSYGDTLAIPETNYSFNGYLRVGYDSTSDLAGNFLIDELRLDNKNYSADDIRRRYLADCEYYDPFSYGITCI
jgi:hypothetical protein